MAGGVVSSPLRSVWVTAVDGADHAVTDDEMAAGRVHGRYVALCGVRVVAVAMATAPGRRCERCLVFLRARATLRELAAPTRRRRRGLCAWRSGWRRG